MDQRYKNITVKTHVQAKGMYQYLLIREHLLTKVDKSGRYEVRGKLKEVATATGTSLKAIRHRIKGYSAKGWIKYDGRTIKINRLRGSDFKLLRLFKAEREALRESENPAILFADMYKLRVLRYAVKYQLLKEAKKVASDRKGLKLVCRKSTKYLGRKDNLHLSLKTIARKLGYKTAQTGKRYIDRMHTEKLLDVRKEAVPYCEVHEFPEAIKRLHVTRDGDLVSMRGRLFVPKGQPGDYRHWIICERKQNSYLFGEARLAPTRNRKRRGPGGEVRMSYNQFQEVKNQMKQLCAW